jgi:hypothetical protein
MAIYEQLEPVTSKSQVHQTVSEESGRKRSTHHQARNTKTSAFWPRFSEKLLCAMDLAGVFASSLCMVHCLVFPIVLALLPVVAQPLMEHDVLHVGLAGFVLFFCVSAYLPGYLRHGDRRLLYVGAAGLSLVFFATFQARYWGEIAEVAILTVGNLLIVFGHLLNRYLLRHQDCRH